MHRESWRLPIRAGTWLRVMNTIQKTSRCTPTDARETTTACRARSGHTAHPPEFAKNKTPQRGDTSSSIEPPNPDAYTPGVCRDANSADSFPHASSVYLWVCVWVCVSVRGCACACVCVCCWGGGGGHIYDLAPTLSLAETTELSTREHSKW